MKRALILGITGQDGAYLSRLLLEKGYQVHGLVRRSSTPSLQRLVTIHKSTLTSIPVQIHDGDILDVESLSRVLVKVQPHEIYNLAAQSNVGTSFGTARYTNNVNHIGVIGLLESIRSRSKLRGVRYYQASTSEIFGFSSGSPLSENSQMSPKSPYAISKLAAYWTTILSREAYGIFAANGILFNHESPLRGADFVTRKITKGVAEIEAGVKDRLELGNLDARRDWGHAKEYVEGMWKILQQDIPSDYVLASGVSYSVRDFVELAFVQVGRSIVWNGEGENEFGADSRTGERLVVVDARNYRPIDIDDMVGDPRKALSDLNWNAEIGLTEIIEEMVLNDLQLVTKA